MNNALGQSDVPLTVFGGAVTEMAPEDLPEGASPVNQDVDYTPGAVFTRDGRKNQFVYNDFFAENLAGFGSSNPGEFDPDEAVWTNPLNITLDVPGTYAETKLASAGGSSSPTLDVILPISDVGDDSAGITMDPDTQELLVVSAIGFVDPIRCAVVDMSANPPAIVRSGNAADPTNEYQGSGVTPFINGKFYLYREAGVATRAIDEFDSTTFAPTGNFLSFPGFDLSGNNIFSSVAFKFGGNSYLATLVPVPNPSGQNLTCFVSELAGYTNLGSKIVDNGLPWTGGGPPKITRLDGVPLVNKTTGEIFFVYAYNPAANIYGGGGVPPTNWKIVRINPFGPVVGGVFQDTSEYVFAADGDGNCGVGGYVDAAGNRLVINCNFGAIKIFDLNTHTVTLTVGGASDIQYGPNDIYNHDRFGSNFVGTIACPMITLGEASGGLFLEVSATDPEVSPGGFQWDAIFDLRSTADLSVQATLDLQDVLGPVATWGGLWDFHYAAYDPTSKRLAYVIGTDLTHLYIFGGIGTGGGAATPGVSQELRAMNFGFSIPLGAKVLGLQVEVSGKQDNLDPDSVIDVSLLSPSPANPTKSFQLGLSQGTAVVGAQTETWGYQLTPAQLNDQSFGVKLVAFAEDETTFDVSAVKLKAYLSPNPPGNNTYVKTYKQDDGGVDTLLLDDQGILWDEDAIGNPGVLNAIFTAIEPNTYAKSVTFLDVEWIALSDLIQGTDMPRQWDGKNLDRVSQVAPGAPPSISSSGAGVGIVSITQPTPKSDPENPGHLLFLWSSGPGQTSPGNVLTVYYGRSNPPGPLNNGDPDLIVGRHVQIAGADNPEDTNNVNNTFNGQKIDGVYVITGLGEGIPPGAQYGRWYFTVQMAVSQFVNQANHTTLPPPAHEPNGTYQVTEATVTTATQVPNLEVGGQMTIAGTGGAPTAGYDGTWPVDETPNASQLAIVSVSRSGGVATYGFTLISGSNPTVGQFVTVVGTLADNRSFNVSNVAINSVAAGSFTVIQPGNDVNAVGDSGSGTISGTIFLFDPGVIVGNKTGGTIQTAGVIGIGVRRAVVMFQTRSGGITPASNYIEFTVSGSAGSLNASNIPIGPPDTIRRIIAFTAANGGKYFYIDQPVTVTDNGQKVTYTSTVIADNTSTTATFSFPDAILLTGIAIDVQGNNLFVQRELGSCLGFLSYSSRLFAWGEQNKVQNFQNLSFDGGIGGGGGNQTFPLGWTVDAAFGAGGSVGVSPQFGNSYVLNNSTGSPQAQYAMITQTAYQNQLGTPIIRSSTQYSARITARCTSGSTVGNLVVDLFSAQLGQVFGAFKIPLASMTSNMQIFTGLLLTQAQEFGTVPTDLLLRVYLENSADGTNVELDRVEPFPTLEPVFATSFTGSYASNPQGFDSITGPTGPNQNQQAIRGGAVMFDLLFALKEGSIFSTSDNGVTEPAFWNWKEVSPKVGTIGINSYDYGEDWLVTACRPGIYFFNGGTPIKVSQEIQTVWDAINWAAGASIWLRNDVVNKRVVCGIPLPTGPGTVAYRYMPEMPANAAPTTPNVVLAISYRELNSGMAFAETGPIKTSYSGRILSPEPARKTSWWNIRSPYADFIDRGNNRAPLFFCTGYGDSKVFALEPDTGDGDDGDPINGHYFTYGFVKPDMADAKGLGLHRMSLGYFTTLATGVGDLNIWVYPESPPVTPEDEPPFVLDSIPLTLQSKGDLESDANITANRFFIRYGTNKLGHKFRLSKVVASMSPDAWSAIRGTGSPD